MTTEGFYPWSEALYTLHPGKAHLYLDDATANVLPVVNGPFLDQALDKSIMKACAGPENFAKQFTVIEDGEILGDWSVDEACVIKPTRGTMGDGVVFRHDGVREEETEALAASGGSWVVEEFMAQHSYASDVWPHSSNTLRFLVFHDGFEPMTAACVHKWGTFSSGKLDNFTKGGVTTWVEDGVLGYTLEDFTPLSARVGFDGERKGSDRVARHDHKYRHHCHPESETPILGTVIPYWNDAAALVLETAERLYRFVQLKYLGFDLMITPTGPRLIEINPDPGVHLIQMHRPLLDVSLFAKFVRGADVGY